ncbi:MAG: hypothetical protein AB8F78_07545 [Saprospiraceae bacterium]
MSTSCPKNQKAPLYYNLNLTKLKTLSLTTSVYNLTDLLGFYFEFKEQVLGVLQKRDNINIVPVYKLSNGNIERDLANQVSILTVSDQFFKTPMTPYQVQNAPIHLYEELENYFDGTALVLFQIGQLDYLQEYSGKLLLSSCYVTPFTFMDEESPENQLGSGQPMMTLKLEGTNPTSDGGNVPGNDGYRAPFIMGTPCVYIWYQV